MTANSTLLPALLPNTDKNGLNRKRYYELSEEKKLNVHRTKYPNAIEQRFIRIPSIQFFISLHSF